MNVADFKLEVVTVLCMTGKQTLGKRGRPNELNQQFAEKKKKGPATHIPPNSIKCSIYQNRMIRGSAEKFLMAMDIPLFLVGSVELLFDSTSTKTVSRNFTQCNVHH
ncbi:hypothetical protein PR048_020832, partial [Dryococelus australis]